LQNDIGHFSAIGIQNLRLHFTRAEKALKEGAGGSGVECRRKPKTP
jgi:hypothetical protein